MATESKRPNYPLFWIAARCASETVQVIVEDKFWAVGRVPVAEEVAPVVAFVAEKLVLGTTAVITKVPLYPAIVAPDTVIYSPTARLVVLAVEYVTVPAAGAIAVIAYGLLPTTDVPLVVVSFTPAGKVMAYCRWLIAPAVS